MVMGKDLESNNLKLNLKDKDGNFTREAAYILGFLWADGSVLLPYRVYCEITKKDGMGILDIFKKTGPWAYHFRQRKGRQDQICLALSDKNSASYLWEQGYQVRYDKAPTILEEIPSDLHYAFVQGLFDGDGCWYFNENNKCRQATISGRIDQDWSFLTKILTNVGVTFNIRKLSYIRKTGTQNSRSTIVICSRESIKKLGTYIYQNPKFIGLDRKYDKFCQILASYKEAV